MGVYGQGLGGTIAAEAMYEDTDRRIDAAINLEGLLDYHPEQPGQDGELLPVARYGVDRPLLLVGTLDPATAVRTMRRHVVSFFDHHLRCAAAAPVVPAGAAARSATRRA